MGFLSKVTKPFKRALHKTFLGDVVSSTTGGLTDLLGISESENMPTLGGYLKNPKGDLMSGVNKFVDPTGIVEGGTKQIGSYAPKEMNPLVQFAGPLVGSIWGPGGAAAGSRISDLWVSGNTGKDGLTDNQSAMKAGLAALAAYAGGKAGGALKGTPTSHVTGGGNVYGGSYPSFSVDSSLAPSATSSLYGSGGLMSSAAPATTGGGNVFSGGLSLYEGAPTTAQGLTKLQKARLLQQAMKGIQSSRGTVPATQPQPLQQQADYDYQPLQRREPVMPQYAQTTPEMRNAIRRALTRARLYGHYA